MRPVLIALVALGAAPVAMAQPPPAPALTQAQVNEMFCVRDGVKLQGFAGDLAESYLNEAAPQALHDRAIKAVQSALAGCRSKHGWNEEVAGSGLDIAVVTLAMERLEAELKAANVTPTVRNTVRAAIRILPKADVGMFYSGAWADDPALAERIRKLAVEKGAPSDRKVLDKLLLWIETDGVAGSALQRFSKDRFGS